MPDILLYAGFQKAIRIIAKSPVLGLPVVLFWPWVILSGAFQSQATSAKRDLRTMLGSLLRP